jgi:hypothetical protein
MEVRKRRRTGEFKELVLFVPTLSTKGKKLVGKFPGV